MQNPQTQEQIQMINELERFIFDKIRLNYSIRFYPFLCCSHEEILRNTIYALHDKGLFKESEEDKIKRLCKNPVKVIFVGKDGNDEVTKLDSEYRPKHYHEVLEAIRSFRSSIESDDLEKINSKFKSIRTAYSSHFDCMYQKNLPLIFRNFLEKGISRSYDTYAFQRIRKQPFYNFVESYIQNYRGRKFTSLKEVYKDLDIKAPQIIMLSIQEEINKLEKLLKIMIDQHNVILGVNEFKNFINEEEHGHLTEADIRNKFPYIQLRQLFPGIDPRKSIMPLPVAEQLKLLNQKEQITPVLYHSPENLNDLQHQFESFNDWKEDTERKIKNLNNELSDIIANTFERSKAYLNERPDLRKKLKEKCVIEKNTQFLSLPPSKNSD